MQVLITLHLLWTEMTYLLAINFMDLIAYEYESVHGDSSLSNTNLRLRLWFVIHLPKLTGGDIFVTIYSVSGRATIFLKSMPIRPLVPRLTVT